MNVHPDLIKLQAEFGANHTYRDAAQALKQTLGEDRAIHNRTRIQRVTKEVGMKLEEIYKQRQNDEEKSGNCQKAPAKELSVAVDGGYVHDTKNKGSNFEVMVSKVYLPENVVRIDQHHTVIKEKHCASSAKYDKQATMKGLLITAAQKEGLNKNKTSVTALADGANNCWNIIDALLPHCLKILCILDWFHVGKYVKRIKLAIPALTEDFEKVRQDLWYGKVKHALSILTQLIKKEKHKDHKRLICNFYDYINNNRERIVDYDKRKKLSLLYSSHVAESTVEHLLNKRAKKHQKMQWSRNGLHAIMQIRASRVSGEWERDWNKIKSHWNVAA